MKRALILLATLGWTGIAPATILMDTTVNQTIPDGDPSGLVSVIHVSAQPGTVNDLIVSLNISGTWNGDLYAYLTHGSGFTVLLNRPGVTATDTVGYGDPGLNVQFQQGAPGIHFYQQTLGGAPAGALSGTWSPDGRAVSPYAVTGTEASTALLSSFNGVDPNGDWTLFVADVSAGDLNQLVSWGIEYAPVPEAPGYGTGLLLAGLTMWIMLRGPKRYQHPGR